MTSNKLFSNAGCLKREHHPVTDTRNSPKWGAGIAPVAVVMLTLNEGHNMVAVLQNLKGWASEVFIVDSYSKDHTVDVALEYGIQIVQRPFRGFGDQWNFALGQLPITAPWTMKLDPDERLSDALKIELQRLMENAQYDGITVRRNLWFMQARLPITERILRIWRTGACRFTDVAVNEHPIVSGRIIGANGELKHLDSPSLDHWLEKQNRYTTSEAIAIYKGLPMAVAPKLLGTSLERRMWLKKNFRRLPARYFLLLMYYIAYRGTWRAGWVGLAWSRLRADVMRLRDYKATEMQLTGSVPEERKYGPGRPDERVQQFE